MYVSLACLLQEEGYLTWMSGFVLMGLSRDWKPQAGLFVFFGATYQLTLLGNKPIVLLIGLNAQIHLPMHSFLGHLSIVDICYTSSRVLQMLVHFLQEKKTISFAQHGAQFLFSFALGGTEFLLLATMAYDHYVAIYDSLLYIALMSPRLCIVLVAVCCLVGLANSATEKAITMFLPTCRHDVPNHMACMDTQRARWQTR
ncbi:olfactory receptor 2F1-like [Loxodonta africana]|uniref:olfactory receptor 2F1-like n=1 Tax=Loxodonta africana TaxID=9785 RepID=UPI000C812935|nr:olfactory receptor 2F1-like [Loxodonta africana]